MNNPFPSYDSSCSTASETSPHKSQHGMSKNAKPTAIRIVCAKEEIAKIAHPKLWTFFGLLFATLFAAIYYIVPILSVVLALWLVFSRFAWLPTTCNLIWFAFAFGPNNMPNNIRHSRLFQGLAAYFQSEIWVEETTAVYNAHQKPVLTLMFPHGVISFGGWCVGCHHPWRATNMAVADILLHMPLWRQISAPFKVCSGSRASLRHLLHGRKEDVNLYPGGLAELFLCHPVDEQLYFSSRKGCVKLAMESGADIRVMYLFGNTQLYKIMMRGVMVRLSRALKVSLAVFWGRYGTIVPMNTKLITVAGAVLHMPDFSGKRTELTPEIVTREHERVRNEIERVFDTYKHLHPEYVQKSLKIV